MAEDININKPLRLKYVVIILSFIAIIIFFNALFHPAISPDVISQWYPIGKWRLEYFKDNFSLPLWNPYMNGGVPALDVGFPFSLSHILTLGFLSTLKTAFGIAYLITVILAGFFSFIYFKSLKLNDFASFLASLIYMLSGDLISYFYPGHLGKPFVMAIIPIVLYLTDRGFEFKKFIYFPIAGVLLGLSYMRHPQIFYYFALFFAFYFLYKTYIAYKENKDIKIIFTIFLWGFSLLLFTILTALPTMYHQLSYQKLTSRGTLKNEEEMWRFATSWSHHPLELLTYFIPSVFGLYDNTYLGWKPFVETTDYLGVITIILAIIGIVITWKKGLTKFNFIALLIMTLFGFGKHFSSFYKLFYNYVPLIKKFRVPASIYLVSTFLIVYFAYYGIVSIINARRDKKLRNIINKILIVTVIFLIFISIWIHSDGYHNILKNNLSRRINVNAIIQKYGFQGEQYINNIIKRTSDMANTDMWIMWLWVSLFVALYYFFVTKKIKTKTFQMMLAIIIFLDLYIVDKKFINTTDNYDIIDKKTPVISFLQQDKSKFRILPILNTNEANKWGLFDLESVTGYHAAGLKIYEDVTKAGLLNNINFLSLFNVKYIITEKLLNVRNLELVFGTNMKRKVYLNKNVLPRYFMVDKFITVNNPEEALELLKNNRIDIRKQIILEENPNINKPLSIRDNSITLKEWKNSIIKFKCKIKNPCFLFLSEVYYPKWWAYINDKRIKVYKTDYLFRSVLLKKGEYTLTFKFHNNGSYLITAIIHYIISIIGIILLIKILRSDKLLRPANNEKKKK